MTFGEVEESKDISENTGDGKKDFDPIALEKFDSLMEDDKIPESEEVDVKDVFEDGDELFDEMFADDVNEGTNEVSHKKGLTEEEKQKIQEETGWSAEVIDAICSIEEYEIYKKAGLKEVEINGKKCLIRDDINWNQVDEKGRTNQQRVEQGLAPLDKNGNAIQLHHIGQHADSPLAELTFEEHRCNGNDTVLHDKTIETQTHGEGNNWDIERQDYWKNRGAYNLQGGN